MKRPDFWGVPEKASLVAEEYARLKEEVDFWRNKEKELKEIQELASLNPSEELQKELEEKIGHLEETIKKEELKIFLTGAYDQRPAVINIIAGQGGRDAEDFVRILLRMYLKYFDKKQWRWRIVHEHFSEEPGGSPEAGGEIGLKNVSLEVETPYAYGYLKNESGVHRLVRISPFDSKDLRHTSFALVEVMPLLEEIDLKDIILDEKDLKIEFARSSGPGGQYVNKRETAVRIVHLPTGLSASSQVFRSQSQNRDHALYLLKLKIFDYLRKQKQKEKELLRKKIEPSWGRQIRNYVLHPYQLVKDLRTGIETNQIEEVFAGEIDQFIEAGLHLKEENVRMK